MTATDHLTLGVLLALELLALTAFAWWGLATGEGAVGRLALGAGVPLAAAGLWGTFVAPRRPVRSSAALRLLVKAGLLAGAALALAETWAPEAGMAFAAAAAMGEAVCVARSRAARPRRSARRPHAARA